MKVRFATEEEDAEMVERLDEAKIRLTAIQTEPGEAVSVSEMTDEERADARLCLTEGEIVISAQARKFMEDQGISVDEIVAALAKEFKAVQ
jgi:hypothetical protein